MMMMIGSIMIIPSSYAIISTSSSGADYSEQVSWQQDHMWHLGKNLSVGDSYTYKICDPDAIQTSAANYHYFTQGNEDHNSSVCYIIKLDFVNLLNSDENQISSNVWVVQAAISDVADSGDVRYSVFHIDTQTFEVRSADTIHPDTIKYTDSLQKTLFSIHKYTAQESQLLQIGAVWGEVTEALYEKGTNPHMTVIDNNQEYSVIQNNVNQLNHQNVPVERNIADVFQVGYEIDIVDPFMISDDDKKNKTDEEDNNNNVTNSFLISSDLPFPLSATSYSPVHVIQPQKQFEFELVSFLTNNKNVDFEIKKPVFEEPKDDVSELLTDRGIIELTFPDDVIPDDDDMEIISEDEIDNDVVSKDDDIIEIISDEEDVIEIISVDDIEVSDDSIAHAKIGGLVILLVVMIAGFVVFKKLREGKLRMNSMKKTLKKTKIVKKKTIISFEEKLHIDIKTLTDDDV